METYVLKLFNLPSFFGRAKEEKGFLYRKTPKMSLSFKLCSVKIFSKRAVWEVSLYRHCLNLFNSDTIILWILFMGVFISGRWRFCLR